MKKYYKNNKNRNNNSINSSVDLQTKNYSAPPPPIRPIKNKGNQYAPINPKNKKK